MTTEEGEVWTQETSLTLPPFIEVSVPTNEQDERTVCSCILPSACMTTEEKLEPIKLVYPPPLFIEVPVPTH